MTGVSTVAEGHNQDNPREEDGDKTPEEKVKNRFEIRKVFFPTLCDKKDTKTSSVIPPPLIVADTAVNIIKSLHQVCNQKQYAIKHLKHGIQLLVNNLAMFTKAKQALLDNNIKFYTYNTDKIKQKKFVLYGLNNDVTIGDIMADLNEYGFVPSEVKPMHIKTPRYANQINYIIYFDAEEPVTLETLNKARYINHTVVKWAHYRASPERITQCRSCFRFNHGTSSCAMELRCLLCSLNHKVADCPLMLEKIRTNKDTVPAKSLKCANCGGQHSAAFIECPKRIEFINRKLRNNNRDRAGPTATTVNQFEPAPTPINNIWNNRNIVRKITPKIITPSIIDGTPKRPRPTTDDHNNQSAETTASTKQEEHPSKKARRRQTTADRAEQSMTQLPSLSQNLTIHNNNLIQKMSAMTAINLTSPNNDNISNQNSNTNENSIYRPEELLKANELMLVFREMLSGISKCKNREEQLNVLLELALKYSTCPV